MANLTLATQVTEQIDTICQQSPIMPVITINDISEALPLATALLDGGISILEITLRTQTGLDAINVIRKALPEAIVGAGTVTNPTMLNAVADAGAQFAISPGLTQELLLAGIDSTIPLLPGIATPSELMQGRQLGYQRFKFFPAAAAGGIPALKALAGPFNDVQFCPTGGINADNASKYLALPNVMCVGGSWVVPSDAVRNKDWQRITELCKLSIQTLKQS
ncbi:bifunctional 4-hydroxy-2-oxoglutarate aldolase/2-dehydro-3-deoxy-phosphogluconate aldolase [Zooshikella harenae]|uniref:2-dehydro-3-deoxy-phosphogluconate aldolase n=1 Tax=Zooshikella harenae TaxID=2827238 RepID=A0ABS5ZCK0_9GAMM|nr:bifunctional 4-hydroxy-2-oxoglutarate aldolase/2-dehydro-3-deoxy-phosphogluconate aldolase [Zooshikella harenae]MBU2710652.1 bifunctional 4-hydroxy-2-oxoglutarate aldolase/2-dehydro-3-deoxy-phosphogluconate aldolase [Zooshikella harenae]